MNIIITNEHIRNRVVLVSVEFANKRRSGAVISSIVRDAKMTDIKCKKKTFLTTKRCTIAVCGFEKQKEPIMTEVFAVSTNNFQLPVGKPNFTHVITLTNRLLVENFDESETMKFR